MESDPANQSEQSAWNRARSDLTPLTLGGSSLISISLWEADTFLSVVC